LDHLRWQVKELAFLEMFKRKDAAWSIIFSKFDDTRWASVLVNNLISPSGVEEARADFEGRFKRSAEFDLEAASRKSARIATLYALDEGLVLRGRDSFWKVYAKRINTEAQAWRAKHGQIDELNLIKTFQLGHSAKEIPQEFALLENIRLFFLARKMIERKEISIRGLEEWVYSAIERIVPTRRLSPGTRDIIFAQDQSVDSAMRTKGGIDLTPANMNLQTKMDSRFRGNDNGRIKFHLDPAMLQQLQNAPGFVPVIINIQPLTDLRSFLGVGVSA
jgi:hypothetical protein